MLLIKTHVAPSSIHGNGLFASEDVPIGKEIWRFLPPFDLTVSEEALTDLPAAVREHLDLYAYRSRDLGGALVLPGDNAKFLNHCSAPNTVERRFASFASRPIAIGDEITCDYGAFCVDWEGAIKSDVKPPVLSAGSRPPHQRSYARLRCGKHGVGVFAITDIPGGVRLFEADTGVTVRVPVHVVDALPASELRRMYYDFCPLIGGEFIAPPHFDLLTPGWYTNHSNAPNIHVGPALEFTSARAIAKGEELTTDYASYSEHARRFLAEWGLGGD
jgi:hypothetical protein